MPTLTGFSTFTFEKLEGVDELSFTNSGNPGNSFRGVNGFSLTGVAPAAAVPEPSSALAIAFVGGLAMLRRRRK